MPLPPVLAGERLELRRWRESHLDRLLLAIASSLEELRRWMPWAQVMPSATAERAAIQASSDRFERGEAFDYFLFERATDALVGAAGVRLPTPGTAEIGYWVRSDRHRRGYATEAARVLTSAAFENLTGVDVVEIHMDKANTASAAVAAKLGFRLDAEEERERLTPGHTGTGLIWSTDRATWSTVSPPVRADAPTLGAARSAHAGLSASEASGKRRSVLLGGDGKPSAAAARAPPERFPLCCQEEEFSVHGRAWARPGRGGGPGS